MAESEDNLSNIGQEDDEIARILDGKHAENTAKATRIPASSSNILPNPPRSEPLNDKYVGKNSIKSYFAIVL